jgi:hypothetical protein
MTKEYLHSPRALDRALRKSAELWWGAAVLLKVGIFIIGALSIFLSAFSQATPYLLAVFSVASEICLIRHYALRDAWEPLHRELDARDSFGWPVSRAEVSDLLTHSSRKLRERLAGVENEEAYFASSKPPGPERAVENIQESAWWAKHLARRAGNFCTALVITHYGKSRTLTTRDDLSPISDPLL